MRDPDLVVRAQQAATALESAWCHWRDVHGLGSDPQPAVSSYVGYSLEAPWGQARVVLGICAEDAERLAALLDRHDCVGPVYAAVTAQSGGRAPGSDPADVLGQSAAGLVHVPAPAPASAGQQSLSAGAAFSRPDQRPGPSYRDPAAASALTSPAAPPTTEVETPIALAASRAVEASMTGRKNGSAAGWPGHHSAGRVGPAAAAIAADRAQDGDDSPEPGPARERGGEVPAGPPEIAALWPPPEFVSPPGPRPPGRLSPADRGERVAGPTETDLARVSRALRGLSFSGFKRQDPPADRAPAPVAAPAEGLAPAEDRPPTPGEDRAPAAARVSAPAPAPAPAPVSAEGRAPAEDRASAPESGHAGAPKDNADRAEPPSQPQGSRGRVNSEAANADAATWSAGELPGQAADTAV